MNDQEIMNIVMKYKIEDYIFLATYSNLEYSNIDMHGATKEEIAAIVKYLQDSGINAKVIESQHSNGTIIKAKW